MRIISRYVLREHLGPLVFAMSALTSLLLLNYIAKQLPQLVGKGLPWEVIAEFVLLSLPFTIAMTLPMAVLVATLHAFSRLAADSEITAFKASGMALPRLMAPVVVAGLLLSLLMVWFNDRVMPAANYALQTLSNDIARKKPTFALRPQVINEVSRQRLYLRAGHLAGGSSEMRDVTIFDFSDPQRRRTIRADSGHVELSGDGRDLLLTLTDGQMTEVSRTEPERLQRVFFTTNHVRVRGIGNDLERNTIGGEKSDREKTVCELQGQLTSAVRQRDSVFAEMRKLDSTAARLIGNPAVPPGTGRSYCRFVRMLRVNTAHAATAQGAAAGAVQGQAKRPDSAATAQAQAKRADSVTTAQQAAARRADSVTAAQQAAAKRVDSATTAQQAPVPAPALNVSPGMQAATQNPVIPPSAGYSPPDYGGVSIPVAVEGMKLQLANSQRIIDGNQVEIEKKFAIATACVIFALLGAPIAFRFPRGGVGLTIGVSLVVFGIYYIGLIAGEELARRGYLPAYVAMWSTNVALLAIGVYLTARLGHEGTTTRGSELSDQVGRAVDRLRLRFRRRAANA